MPIRHLAACFALLVTASGCTVSEHGICPIDGGDQAVFEPDLLGDWSILTEELFPDKAGPKAAMEEHLIRFERLNDDSNTYLIGERDQAGKPVGDPPLRSHLVPIGKGRYLDMIYTDPKKKEETIHLLIKVEGDKERLTFRLMDPGYFAAHPSALPTTKLSLSGQFPAASRQKPEFSIELPKLAAETPKLRKFLEEHENDQELWPAGWTMKLVRKPTRPASEPRAR